MTIAPEAVFALSGYTPHARQWEYHRSRARFKVPVCGRRFGKSTMAAKDLEPELFDERKMFWIVGPTYDLGEKEFRVLWNDLIIGQKLGRHPKVQKRYNKKQGDMWIKFPWGTRVEVRSADHPENLVGEALNGIIMSEAAKHKVETFERYIRPALADYRGWATFPTTPEGQNWLYDMWRLGHNPGFPDYAAWCFPSWENPVLYPGGRTDPEIFIMEETMEKEWFEQEIAADFTAYVGKIFGEFREVTHVQEVEFNPAWPNYMAFDFGYVNPLAAIEFQITPWDQVRIWREHYQSYWLMERHVSYLREGRENPEGYHLDLAFGDAADPEAVDYISSKLVRCVASSDAKANWRDGIDLVKSFLKMRQVGISDEYGTPYEVPGLVVDHNCARTIFEFNNYKAPPMTGGRTPTSPREIGVKVNDHAMDALRYALVHIYRLGALYGLLDGEEPVKMYDKKRLPGEMEQGQFTSKVSF